MQITLKAARVNRNWTCEEAASVIQKEMETLGAKSRKVTKDIVRDWESGRTIPNVLHVKAIEKAYGVSYNDLLFMP